MLRDCAAPLVVTQRALRDRVAEPSALRVHRARGRRAGRVRRRSRSQAVDAARASRLRHLYLRLDRDAEGSAADAARHLQSPALVQSRAAGHAGRSLPAEDVDRLRRLAGRAVRTACRRRIDRAARKAAANATRATLVRTIAEHGISVLQTVPSALRALLAEAALDACTSLRYLVCGGEALDRELAREVARRLPHLTLGNFYGPTEASIDATWHEVHAIARRRRHGAARPADRQRALPCARRAARAGADRCRRRAVHRRCRPRAGLPEPPGADRAALRRRPVPRRRAPVSQRRPGPLPCRRNDRVRRARRRAGQAARLSHRARRDRGRAECLRRRAASAVLLREDRPGRAAARRVRRRRRRRGRAARGAAGATARAHGAVGVRAR